MRIYDEFFKIKEAVSDKMPWHFDSHMVCPNLTGLPKNFIVASVEQNEKFLDNWQSTIEDHTPDAYKKSLIEYQNKRMSPYEDLSSNHKESFFKYMPRKLHSITQPLVTFGREPNIERGCTGYGPTIENNNSGSIGKPSNFSTIVQMPATGTCYTHMAVHIKGNYGPGTTEAQFFDSAGDRAAAAIDYSPGLNSFVYVEVYPEGFKSDTYIRCGFYGAFPDTSVYYSFKEIGDSAKKSTSTSYLPASGITTTDADPTHMKTKGVEP
tara:strand:+ start:204 stop:1001 length:798 start_codon:yes stop_codon:yes gene_type:complete